MSEPPDDPALNPAVWMEFAESDLSAAQVLRGAVPGEIACFHAQQAAEKAIKAFLVAHGVVFPFTHNIDALVALCIPHGGWARTLESADSLTRYAGLTRYPGIGRRISSEEVDAALDEAARVVALVRAALGAGA